MVTYRNPSYLIFDKGTSFYNTSQVFTGNSFTCFVTCYNKFLIGVGIYAQAQLIASVDQET